MTELLSPELFSAAARWLWLAQPHRDKNSYACFRRMLELSEVPSRARIRITADSRYELWINGQFVGHGPVRSWPSPWPVDEYDIAALLKPGRNVVGVLVTHFGISTFQYLHDAPGLIAQIDLAPSSLSPVTGGEGGGEGSAAVGRQRTDIIARPSPQPSPPSTGEREQGMRRIVTDASWKSTAHDGYLWPVPRITCQQAWEEQFDARIAPGLAQDWSSPAFDDARWSAAKELPGGHPSHKEFEPRDIPMLTCEPTPPVAIVSSEVVRPADYSFALNPREFINAIDKSANHINARMLLATWIHSDRAQKIDLHQPHTRPFLPWKLNGVQLNFDDKSLHNTDTGVAHATLKAGANALMVRLPESEHHYWANLNVRTEHPVTFAVDADKTPPTPPSSGTGWIAFGPFPGPAEHAFDKIVITPTQLHPRATLERLEAAWKRGELTEDDDTEPFCRQLLPEMVATRDIYAISASDRVESSIKPRIDNPDALLRDGGEWATIHPAHDGAGVRVLFDFGREVIGFQELEIDAAEGTIVDFHNFEFIQKDGRFNLCESMNNSFRYVCKAGAQRYRTFLRRGFKYSWMTLRDFHQPVKVRGVRVLMSTYPPTGSGSFECSDEKLTEIWRVGVHSVRCCAEDTYTDCPTYEQTFWVGDARNEALVDLIANGDPRLSSRCLRLTGRSLDRSSIAESQVPSGWRNVLPTWTFLWMRWAQEHYQLTGDKAFAREMLGYLDRNFAGMKKEINEQGLFAMFGWNLFDWAPMDTPGNGIVTHINCLASQGLAQCAQLARDVGDEAKAREWDSAARGLADAVNQHLWSREKNAYVDCIRADGTLSPVFSQQTQTAAYISGVATGDREERCRAIVHNPPADFVKAGSPFFMFFLLEALVREERYDQMIETIRAYWGKQIDAGATTFWEMYHDGAARLTRSHCHGWSAAPTFFLTQHVLGVQPLEAGYAKVRIAPKLGTLKWARGKVPTPAGVVQCAWKRDAGNFELAVDGPQGSAMQIELPLRGDVKIVEGEGRIEGATVIAPGPRIRISVRA